MALNMPQRLCYQQTINSSDVWCFHKHFIFIFLCSCLYCLLRPPSNPRPARLLFSRISFYFHYSISREIYWNWFRRNFCFHSGDCEADGADGWGRETHAANIIHRYLYFAISVLEWFIFLLFYQEAGVWARRTQFMFVTVKEISLPMHPPRNNFRLEHLTTVHMSHFAIKRRCLASK